MQVVRFHAHVGSANRPFQKAPEVLKTVSVYSAIHISYSVIHNLMGILASQSRIGQQRIVKGGAKLDHWGGEKVDHFRGSERPWFEGFTGAAGA